MKTLTFTLIALTLTACQGAKNPGPDAEAGTVSSASAAPSASAVPAVSASAAPAASAKK